MVAEVPRNTFHLPGGAALFEVHAPGGPVGVANVHLPTARPGLEAVMALELGGRTTWTPWWPTRTTPPGWPG